MIRKIIKSITPPIIFSLFRLLRGNPNKGREESNQPEILSDYENANILKILKARAEAAILKIDEAGIDTDFPHINAFFSVLYALSRLDSPTISILDIGGGGGIRIYDSAPPCGEVSGQIRHR